jgi:hypothetical protein
VAASLMQSRILLEFTMTFLENLTQVHAALEAANSSEDLGLVHENCDNEEMIDLLASSLRLALRGRRNHVRPLAANMISESFLDAGTSALGTDESFVFLGAFEAIDAELLAEIINNLTLTEPCGRVNRLLALDAAQSLTPAKAQQLYHFAVLLTKLV